MGNLHVGRLRPVSGPLEAWRSGAISGVIKGRSCVCVSRGCGRRPEPSSSHSGVRLWLRGLAALALSLAPLLATAPEARAIELVSNTGQTAFGSVFLSGSSRLAQGFTTGGNTGGYALDEVQIRVNSGFGGTDAVRVGIWSADGDGNPDAILHALTNPSTVTNGALNSFTAPEGSTLGRNAQYFVVVEAASGSFHLGQTGSDAEDGGAATGWSIADERHSHDGTSWSGGGATNLFIAIQGRLLANLARRWRTASPTRWRRWGRTSRTSSRRTPSLTSIPTTPWNTLRRWPTAATFRPG